LNYNVIVRYPYLLKHLSFDVGGADKLYLSLLGSLAMMHVIDVILDSFSNLFRSHRYPPLEEALFCLSLRSRPKLEG
jgi:hypothetical protein